MLDEVYKHLKKAVKKQIVKRCRCFQHIVGYYFKIVTDLDGIAVVIWVAYILEAVRIILVVFFTVNPLARVAGSSGWSNLSGV